MEQHPTNVLKSHTVHASYRQPLFVAPDQQGLIGVLGVYVDDTMTITSRDVMLAVFCAMQDLGWGAATILSEGQRPRGRT